jgi:hypothetical protein
MPLSEFQFRKIVYDWLSLKRNDIISYYSLNGGWEAWTQAEVAVFTKKRNINYDILREQPIYPTSGEYVDWVLNLNTPINLVGIELKCESLYSGNYFLGRVYNDVYKISNCKNLEGYLFAYFLTCNPNSDVIMNDNNLYDYRYTIVDANANTIYLYVITHFKFAEWYEYRNQLSNDELLEWSKFQIEDDQLRVE